MTSDSLHEDAAHRENMQGQPLQKPMQRQGGEPDFDSAWQALRNLTESSIARNFDKEFDYPKTANTSGMHPAYQKVEAAKQHVAKQVAVQARPSMEPELIAASKDEVKRPGKIRQNLSGIALCAVYTTAGFLGAGLIDKVKWPDFALFKLQSNEDQSSTIVTNSTMPPIASTLTDQVAGNPSVSERLSPYRVVVSSALIRSAPSMQAKVVGSINRATVFLGKISSVDNQWLEMSSGQYVNGSLVENLSPIRPNVSMWATDANIPVYQSADTSSMVVKTLSYAEQVKGIQAEKNDWFKLSSGGYARMASLASNKPFYSHSAQPVLAAVNVDKAPLMSAPRASARVSGIYFRAKNVTVSRIIDGWAQVGEDQFIKASLLKKIEPQHTLSQRSSK